MKKYLLALLAVALLAPAAQAQASGLDFNLGFNFGIPFVTARVYEPAPRYHVPPARVCEVERIHYRDGYRERRDYEFRQERVRYIHALNMGRDRDDRGWNRENQGRLER